MARKKGNMTIDTKSEAWQAYLKREQELAASLFNVVHPYAKLALVFLQDETKVNPGLKQSANELRLEHFRVQLDFMKLRDAIAGGKLPQDHRRVLNSLKALEAHCWAFGKTIPSEYQRHIKFASLPKSHKQFGADWSTYKEHVTRGRPNLA